MSYEIDQWCWSPDQETYGDTFATREEAVSEARTECGCGIVWIAQVGEIFSIPMMLCEAIDVDDLEERAGEYLGDHTGCEGAADRVESSEVHCRQLQIALEATIWAWARTHELTGGVWYQVKNVERIELDEDGAA